MPHFYGQAVSSGLLADFIDTFGQILEQVETDLLTVMNAHYVETATNIGSEGLDNTTAKLGDLDKILALYLGSLGGTSQLHQGSADVKSYRERMLGLIRVLKGGAATRAGILEIVAANLGIMGNSPEAEAARAMIRLEEFAPEVIAGDVHELAVFEEFTVQNPSVVNIAPEISLRVRPDLLVPLVNPRLLNLTTGQSIQYQGLIRQNAVLTFFPNSTAMADGVPVPSQNLLGRIPELPPGGSRWRFESALGLAACYFDQSFFENAVLEQDRLNVFGLFDTPNSQFDNAVFVITEPVITLQMIVTKLTPGRFLVRVPWHIPGITEKYDASETDPRNQIKYIIERVKAAGVSTGIAYEQFFQETQELDDQLTLDGELRQPEVQEMSEHNFDIGGVEEPYPGGVVHQMQDRLKIAGVFGATRLDYMIFGE